MMYENVITFLENQTVSHGISYLKEALQQLKISINPAQVILVAGTNGKGSTCATLETLLRKSGKNVGLFSSPHLERINERIKFNRIDISDSDFCEIFHRVHASIGRFDLSYFEYITLMAIYYFFVVHRSDIDYAIMEAGLGGAFDATNIIPHNISVITKLGMDHEEYLGKTIAKIAANKFGIIHKNNIVFHTKFEKSSPGPATLRELRELAAYYATKYTATFIEAYDYSLVVTCCDDEKYPTFFIENRFGKFRINLPGERGAENTSLAITVFDYLNGEAANIATQLQALEQVHWPGRMERVSYKNHDIFLSGDHNPQGILSLLDILRYYKFRQIHFVCGICCDKNYRLMLSLLRLVPGAELYLTENVVKTVPLENYGAEFVNNAVVADPDPLKTLNSALQNAAIGNDDLVVVTGSLYLVGFVRKFCDKIEDPAIIF
jgi:dihydrofolate synthase/folylpolyglutamate synthase